MMDSMARGGGTAPRGAAVVQRGFSGEAGREDGEGDALHLRQLVVCVELLYGTCNRLGEPLWVRVRGEACQWDILVGDQAPAIRVRKWTKPYLSKPGKSPDP